MDKLFNKSIKEEYIRERIKEVAYNEFFLKGRFMQSAPFEEKLGKDLCNFNYYDIVDMYKLLNVKSLKVLNVTNSVYSTYTAWCIANGMVDDGQNHFKELSTNDYKSCLSEARRKQSRISRNELMQLVKELPNAKDRYIILGLFEIGKTNDFEVLKKAKFSDLDESNNTLQFNGRKIHISDDLLKIILDCKEETYYIALRGDGINTPLKDTGRIFKDHMNTKDEVSDYQLGRRVYTHMRRCMDYLGLLNVISPSDIVSSGIIHFIKSRASEMNIDNRDYLNNYKEEINNQFNIKIVPYSFIDENEGYI